MFRAVSILSRTLKPVSGVPQQQQKERRAERGSHDSDVKGSRAHRNRGE
jgi:hypothetical protein